MILDEIMPHFLSKKIIFVLNFQAASDQDHPSPDRSPLTVLGSQDHHQQQLHQASFGCGSNTINSISIQQYLYLVVLGPPLIVWTLVKVRILPLAAVVLGRIWLWQCYYQEYLILYVFGFGGPTFYSINPNNSKHSKHEQTTTKPPTQIPATLFAQGLL